MLLEYPCEGSNLCGIFGAFSAESRRPSKNILEAMAKSILHRGPDHTGIYSEGLCSLGNCRLSIIDLSDSANQPQMSNDGNIILVQNGEIYNYVELRKELESLGCQFKTSGDTDIAFMPIRYGALILFRD